MSTRSARRGAVQGSRRRTSSGGGAPTPSTGLRATTGLAMYAASSIYSQTGMQAWRNAGGTHVNAQVFWDRWQTSQEGPIVASAVAEWRQWCTWAQGVGLRVVCEIQMNSAPGWYASAAPRFRQQNGTEFTGDGDKLRDAVFSTISRTFQADFIAKVFATLTSADLAMIDIFRVGGGPSGELSYPSPHAVTADGSGWDWWMFSAAAQSGTNRVPTIPAPPITSRYPGQGVAAGTTWSSSDDNLNAWYQNALVDYMKFLIKAHRDGGWTGMISVLHPSWGLRPTRGSGDSVFRNEAAQGTDWARQMDAYPDDAVAPWCTWGERQSDGTTDGTLSPTRYMYKLAQTRSRAWGFIVENASGATVADMDRLFTDAADGAIGGGYARGLLYVSYEDAVGGASGEPTLSYLSGRQNARPADASRFTASSGAAGKVDSAIVNTSTLG